MERIDFIDTREDVIANIKTLYSYLNGHVIQFENLDILSDY